MPASIRTTFPPAFYANLRIGQLTPEQHDELLANGWFRNDVNVFASSIKFMGDAWRSCVMLRLPLAHFTWKKRLRKLMRKNGELFTVAIRPFQQTQEKEALWQNFKRTVHQWVLIPQLDKHLLKNSPPRDFNTWELCVYKNGKLAAFSIFDRGNTSIASLEAAYDPAFRDYSLGIYTMLMEIEFAQQTGLTYYYPGFYPKGVDMFEYKLRPGSMEFFRLNEKRWLPLEALEESDWLLEQVLAKFETLKKLLENSGLVAKTGYGIFHSYPSQEPAAWHYNILMVIKNANPSSGHACLIAWDPVEVAYFAFTAFPILGQAFWGEIPGMQAVRLLDPGHQHFLGKYEDTAALAAAVVSACQGR
jgi:arginyl-tRNA--protein-N-Asp/Glu arginylyltransferase